ncbi:hypothetical protein IFM89_011250 [Coptis chinensis]|uniref:Pentatricopeptide repeat-containing protein n=1 Tax=Coptis chinensis TaxID=261450 RepID=A0A835LQ23_9MAGN|nr:hypothetical protein IFM89_011250 [Coptis chinensis]
MRFHHWGKLLLRRPSTSTLNSLQGDVETARKFFHFVDETENERMFTFNCYYSMLGILGTSGKEYVHEFWRLLQVMKKKKGSGISKTTYDKVADSFQKDGLLDDLDKLKGMYSNSQAENSMKQVASRISNVINEKDSFDFPSDVQQKILDINCIWSPELIKMVVEKVVGNPRKILLFFWWFQVTFSFKPDYFLYDAVVKVLAHSHNFRYIGCMPFWRIVVEMKACGHEMEMETYSFVMLLFCKKQLIEDAVELYEYKMGSATKPPVQDGVSLFRNVVEWGRNLDMRLFSKVVETFTEGGYSLTTSILDEVVKSLISVEKVKECDKILKAMEKGGCVPSSELYNKIIYHLATVGGEAVLMMSEMKASGHIPDSKTWTSLIFGQCVAGDVKKASNSVRTMVKNFGITDAGPAFEEVVNGFCQQRKTTEAYKFLFKTVREHHLKPQHSTYKMLIWKLLAEGRFNEALILLGLMNGHGFSPFLDPFIDHISKSGSGDDAISFLNAVTDKKFPSTSVVLRMIEAFLKVGRHSEARDCFSKCPSYVRNRTDVLKLFVAHEPEGVNATAVAA